MNINILMKSESFLTLHWQQHIQGPEQYKDIIKVIHVTPVV